MASLEDARQRWLQDRPAFERFGQVLVQRLRDGLRKEGLWGEVSGRAKEVHSLILKLIKKPDHTYESLGDKCGVRVLVRFKSEIQPVLDLAKALFECGEPENTVQRLEFNQVGYLSTHVDVALYAADSLAQTYRRDVFRAELQVRSLAQHLWSDMSHDTVYKNDEALLQLPNELKRRVFLLAGAIEIADNEFDSLNQAMPATAQLDLLKALEKHYFKLSTRRPDALLSLQTIEWLHPIYQMDVGKIKAHLDELWRTQGHLLQEVYDRAEREDAQRSAFLFQPEALMIFDLLLLKRWDVSHAWMEHDLPMGELELIANAFGISLNP